MGLFAKFKAGLQKTHNKLTHEIKRIVTRSPKLDAAAFEDLEASLLGADLGTAITGQIIVAVKQAYETQGNAGGNVFAVARREVENSLASNKPALRKVPAGLTVVSIVRGQRDRQDYHRRETGAPGASSRGDGLAGGV